MKEVISIYIMWLLAGTMFGALLGMDGTQESNNTSDRIFTFIFGLFCILPWLPIVGLTWLYYKAFKKDMEKFPF